MGNTIRGMYVYAGFEIVCKEYAGTFLECEDANGKIVEIDVNAEMKGWLGNYLEHLDDMEYYEKEFGSVNFEGKKYILTSQAEITSRLLPYPKNYNDVSEGEEYDFEMSAGAIDKDGNNYEVYWIFSDIKGDSEKELDSFNYDDVDRVVEC